MGKFFLLLCVAACTLRAGQPCPWMNAATAGGILGGESAVAFTAAANGLESGVCQFVRVDDHKSALQIHVAVMKSVKAEWTGYVDKCGTDVRPLKGIGNEAVVCKSDLGQQVVGRVRDQAFVITINAP